MKERFPMDMVSSGLVGLLVIAGIIVVALLGIGFVFSRLYRRTTRDTAFVARAWAGARSWSTAARCCCRCSIPSRW